VVGAVAGDMPNNAGDAACNMAAGELIADAQLAATAAPAFGGAQIAFMNRGGVRAPGFTFAQRSGEGDGNVTYGEAFAVQPFGNSLVTMTLSAQDLKDLLEQQFAGCAGQPPNATRILLPSRGFSYRWDGARACGERISQVVLTRDGRSETLVDGSGRVSDAMRRYRVTVNSFLAAGGDSFGVFKRGTASLGGAQDIDALVAYFAAFQPPRAPYRADAQGPPRIQRRGGSVCPLGAATDP
jgi:5'-nucleotidase